MDFITHQSYELHESCLFVLKDSIMQPMSQAEFCGFYDEGTGKCQIREIVKQKLNGVGAGKQALVTALSRLVETPPSNAKVEGQEWTCNRGHFSKANPEVLQKQLGCNRIGAARALQSI